ncbi:hypothetical protein PALU110988_28995 [Paenibacillus lupini]|nr:hypothetical protein [Paenibacillus lupini]
MSEFFVLEYFKTIFIMLELYMFPHTVHVECTVLLKLEMG